MSAIEPAMVTRTASADKSRSLALIAGLIAFYSGFAVMGYEIILARALTPYFGGSVYTWGAVISVFLIGMTIGFMVGGKVADTERAGQWAAGATALSGLLLLITPPLLEPVSIALIDTDIEPRYGAALGALVFGFVPAALLAMLSPYSVKIALTDLTRTGAIAGRLSGLNALGSIMGTLATTFIFIPLIGGRMIIISVGVSALIAAVLLFQLGRVQTRAALSAVLAVAFGVTMLTAPDSASADEQRNETVQAGQRLGRVIERVESLYNHIFIVERARGLIYMTFGHAGKHYTESAWDPDNPQDMVVNYTKFMSLGLLYGAHEGEIGFVGLGGGRTAGYLTRLLPDIRVDVAELDPEVVRLAREHFAFEETDRLTVQERDGRIFLYRAREKYEYIYLDAYRGPFVPFHLTTKEFYELCQRKLAEGGVVVQNVAPNTMLLDSAYKTIDAVFDNVDAYDTGGNIVLIAYDGPRLSDDELSRRAAAFDEAHAPTYTVG